MDDSNSGDGPSPISKRFTLTGLTSVSDESLSPVISKLVQRAVGTVICGYNDVKSPSEYIPRRSSGNEPRGKSGVINRDDEKPKRHSGDFPEKQTTVGDEITFRPSSVGGILSPKQSWTAGEKSPKRLSAEGAMPPKRSDTVEARTTKGSITQENIYSKKPSVEERVPSKRQSEEERVSSKRPSDEEKRLSSSRPSVEERAPSKRQSEEERASSKRPSDEEKRLSSSRSSGEKGISSQRPSDVQGISSSRPSGEETVFSERPSDEETIISKNPSLSGEKGSDINGAGSNVGYSDDVDEPKQQSEAENDSVVCLRPALSTHLFNLEDRAVRTSTNVSINSAKPSDSAQVLVPVNTFPDESEFRMGRTESFMHRHTIPIESYSVVGTNVSGGLRLHRNPASLELEYLEVDSNIHEIENRVEGGPIGGNLSETAERQQESFRGSISESAPTETTRDGAGDLFPSRNVIEALGGLGGMFAGGGGVSAPPVTSIADFETLIDEMACQVALMADDVYTYKGYFERAYNTFSELAKAAASKIAAANAGDRRSSSGSDSSSSRPGTPREPDRPKLPHEVRDRVLRTLSDIKTQLSSVKTKLKK